MGPDGIKWNGCVCMRACLEICKITGRYAHTLNASLSGWLFGRLTCVDAYEDFPNVLVPKLKRRRQHGNLNVPL